MKLPSMPFSVLLPPFPFVCDCHKAPNKPYSKHFVVQPICHDIHLSTTFSHAFLLLFPLPPSFALSFCILPPLFLTSLVSTSHSRESKSKHMWGWGGITAELVGSLRLVERLGIVGRGGRAGRATFVYYIFPPLSYLVLSQQRLLLYKHKIDSGGEVSGSLYTRGGVCVFVYMRVCAVCLPEKESHLICGVGRDMRQFVHRILDTADAASTICSTSRFHQARGVGARRRHHQKRETGREREKSKAALVH